MQGNQVHHLFLRLALVEVPCSRRNSLIGLHQELTLTAKSFATFRKADDMIKSVIGIIVIHFNAALE
jgi:hypothetical protein